MLPSDVAREQNPHELESIIRNDDSGKRKSAVVQAPVSRLYLYTSDAQRVLVFFSCGLVFFSSSNTSTAIISGKKSVDDVDKGGASSRRLFGLFDEKTPRFPDAGSLADCSIAAPTVAPL